MAKIVAGIDFSYYHFALSFLDRLAFKEADVRLVHVIESMMPDNSFPDVGSGHPLAAIMEEQARQGKAELASALQMLGKTGYRLHHEMHRGEPARVLIECAKRDEADLIAVGSARKGTWGSLFFGSVSKALTSGAEPSILVAKSAPRSADGLTAVFATDHSPYCDACIDRFLAWKVRGIRKAVVVTGALPTSAGIEWPVEGLDQLEREIEAEIETRNVALCRKIEAAGVECRHRIVFGHANEAIDTAMEESGADLLIMGARGHGFWDRLRLGSVSHHQVVVSPHNVLVIRV